MEKQQSVSGYKVDTVKMKGSGSVPSDRCNLLKTWCRRGESNPHESHPSPDFESAQENVESLGNIRNNNHLTGFSANPKTERLGRIRNQSGRHLGDTFVGLKALGSSAAAGRGSEESHGLKKFSSSINAPIPAERTPYPIFRS